MEHKKRPSYYAIQLDDSPWLVSTYNYDEAGNPSREDKSGMYKLHWSTSSQYATYDKVQVIENYGVITEDPDLVISKDEVNIERFRGTISDDKINDPDYPIEDLIKLHFAKTYIPVKPTIPTCSDGWISPDGKFYSCDIGQHISLASALAKILYEPFDEERCLEEHKWLKMYNTGRVAYLSAKNVSPPQLDCLIFIRECATDLPRSNLTEELFEVCEKQVQY